MTTEEIKQILLKHYGEPPDTKREIIRFNLENCVLFVLSGTPPKGYGIYIKAKEKLNLYDNEGKRFETKKVELI